MACLSLGLTPPQLPSIFLPTSVGLSLNLGTVGVTCCHFKIPLAAVAIPIPIPATVLMPAIAAVNTLLSQAFSTLDSIQVPNCPSE